ncbi:MAG: hypothetical protein HY270_05275 [Deltaproteobacteria bacterium]|nr:hypothetical protein [Deltaproteobacteria bacterium]
MPQPPDRFGLHVAQSHKQGTAWLALLRGVSVLRAVGLISCAQLTPTPLAAVMVAARTDGAARVLGDKRGAVAVVRQVDRTAVQLVQCAAVCGRLLSRDPDAVLSQPRLHVEISGAAGRAHP